MSARPADPLDASGIAAAIRRGQAADGAPGPAMGAAGLVHVFESRTSTNTHLLGLARQGAPEGTIVVADEQTAGRGRFDRAWHSARGLGLWFSLLLRPRLTPETAAPITIVAGLSVREAVERVSGAAPRLKWPNDVWLEGRKLAGILAETSRPAGAEPAPLIIGIGVNVHHEAADFPPELRARAISLAMAREAGMQRGGAPSAVAPPARGALLAEIVNAFAPRYRHYLEHGLAPFIDEWDRHALWIGERVRVTAGKRVHRGVALGLARSGGLRLRRPDGEEEVLVSGELEPEA